MKVSELGEFGLIHALTREIGLEYPPSSNALPRPGLLVDIGDDAAVGVRRTGAPVWTTDTLVAGMHFLPGRSAWEAVGWKALAVNVSDIAAMGATAETALVTFALPEDFEVDDATALYRGLAAAAGEYSVILAGGDIVRSPVFSVTISIAGRAYETDLGEPAVMRRNAARPGDVVAVTGYVGDSAAGLALLIEPEREYDDAERHLIHRHQRPAARLTIAHEAIATGVRCAIDISDGLLQDLGHVGRASGVGIRVDSGRLPISEELTVVFPGRAAGLALTGGEDYELALIGPAAVIEHLLRDGDVPVTRIGEVVTAGDGPGRAWAVDQAGREIPIDVAGWDHLRDA